MFIIGFGLEGLNWDSETFNVKRTSGEIEDGWKIVIPKLMLTASGNIIVEVSKGDICKHQRLHEFIVINPGKFPETLNFLETGDSTDCHLNSVWEKSLVPDIEKYCQKHELKYTLTAIKPSA